MSVRRRSLAGITPADLRRYDTPVEVDAMEPTCTSGYRHRATEFPERVWGAAMPRLFVLVLALVHLTLLAGFSGVTKSSPGLGGTDLADWRVRFSGMAQPELVLQVGHSHDVTSVAFSPDGTEALSGSQDGTLRLWDLASGKCLLIFEGHSQGVTSVAFSPNGTLALSGSEDKTLKLWNLASGKCVRTFKGHSRGVRSVAFSPDGTQALSGSEDKTLKLWDLASGKCLQTFDGFFRGHSSWVTSVAFSPDGTRVLSGSWDKTLKLWDLGSGKCIRTLKGHSRDVTSVVFSPDGTQALSGSLDETLKLWDLASGKCVQTSEGYSWPLASVVFSPDGTQALAGAFSLYLWDLASSGKCLRKVGWHSLPVTSVAFSPDGTQALSGSDDNTLKLWDLASGKCLRTLEGHSSAVASVAFSSDGTQVLSGNFGKTLKLWDLASGKCVQTSESPLFDSGYTVALSPDGTQVILMSGFDNFRLRDLASGKGLRRYFGNSKWVRPVAFSPDGTQALSGSDDETLKLWDLASGKCVRTFEGHSEGVRSVAFSPDGTEVLSGSDDNTLKLWDLASGKCLRTFRRHSYWGVLSVDFSPDGTQVLSGGGDNTLILWNLSSRWCVRIFRGHSDWVRSVAFSPDGTQALSGSIDGTLKLWDLVSGKCLLTFEGHSSDVTSVAFSPDGTQALSGSLDGTVRLWNANTGHGIASFIGLDDGRWVVRTPLGYYNASEGRDLFTWTVGMEIYPIDAFPNPYYRPDLVEQTLQRGSSCPVPDRPPVLRVALEFQEKQKDGVLDAEETATVVVTVANMGAGAACLERLDLGTEALDGIRIEGGGDLLDNLGPGEEVSCILSLASDRTIRDGTGRVVVSVAETNGFDADPVAIEFAIRAFRSPDVQIAGFEVDDDQEGKSFGNRNGMVDPGETVEMGVRICNKGEGATRKTRVRFEVTDSGGDVTGQEMGPFDLGDLAPGQCADRVVVFMVNKRFTGRRVPVRLVVEDERADLVRSRDLDLAIAERPRTVRVVRIPGVIREEPEPTPRSVDEVVPLPTPTRPNDFAVLVGIEHYRDLPQAKFARRDAEVMRKYLIQTMGFREENVWLLLDEQATHTDIKGYIEEWLPKNVSSASRVLFYYSGHGTPDPKSREAYLLPYDGKPNYIKSSGYSLARLRERLAELPAREVVVIVDACFSGRGGRSVSGSKFIVPADLVEGSERMVVLAASQGDQAAGWDEDAQHGLLTFHLLEALRGAADMDGDRWVTLKEAFLYVKKTVPRTAARENREQKPHLSPEPDRLGKMGTLRLTRLPDAD